MAASPAPGLSKRSVVLGLVGVAAALAVLWAARGRAAVSCEVCVRLRGQEACGSVAAESREVAVRAATDTACGKVGSSMPDRMQCRANPPLRVECRDRRR